MIRNIIFDFDGVILESVDIKTQAFAELFSEYPDHLEDIIKHHKNNSGVSRYEKIKYYLNLIHKSEADNGTFQYYLKQFGKIISEKIKSAKGKNIYYQYFLNSNTKSIIKLQYKKESGIDMDIYKLDQKKARLKGARS